MTVDLPPSAAPRAAYPAEVLPERVRERLLALAAERTPVSAYLYDPAVAADRARALREALPGWAEVFYAVKANSFAPVVEALAPQVDGFEVASVAELELTADAARAAGRPHRVVAAGPGKTEALLTALVRADAEVVNAESLLELHRLSRIAAACGRTTRVALRVNPASVPIRGSLGMGGAPTQFGVPEPDVPGVLAQARDLPGLDVVGFHIHAASNNLDAAAHAAYLRWCLEWSARTAAACGVRLRHVDIGGGIGVDFELPGGQRHGGFDTALFGRLAAGITPPPGVRVVLEPGRYLVADCGWYAAAVTDVKYAYGAWYAVLRGGIHHFQLPTSWELVHNAAVLPVDGWPAGLPRPVAAEVPVTVVGELCTPEDTLLRDVRVERVRAGDLVVFPVAGSYGWEFAMHSFLGHPVADRLVLPARAQGPGR
ncbi:alanine racemase [Streptomyces sp. NPDC092296]|uniref:alanine racemase n=1 Tax=Streptomyces sp. NPDC092296 TaxID=3366012 RepID=UPI00380A4918